MAKPRVWMLSLSGALLLVACGSDSGDTEGGATGTTSPPAPTTSGTPSPSPTPTPSGTDGASPAASAAAVRLDDQTGDGAAVTVARVDALQAGFVVITVHDRPSSGVLGVESVPAGSSSGVEVVLDPALVRDTKLDATLHVDMDGDGAFDPAVDEAVADPARDRDGDRDDDSDQDRSRDETHDVVYDDAEYRLS